MKRCLFLLLALCTVAVSCNLEKRLYRSGWYFEKNKPHTFTAELPANDPISSASAYEQHEKSNAIPAAIPAADAIDSTIITPPLVDPVMLPQAHDTTLPKKDIEKMSRRELLKSMKDKGCTKPNSTADTLYWLSILSICLFWMFPVALILAIVVIILSDSAEEEAMKGDCPRENIALVRKARRIAIGFLLVTLFAIIAFLAFLAVALVLLIAGIV